jgi:hypothetical protein
VKLACVGLGGQWQFWTGTTWSTVEADAARLPVSEDTAVGYF